MQLATFANRFVCTAPLAGLYTDTLLSPRGLKLNYCTFVEQFEFV